MKNLLEKIQHLLREYSPLALLILTIPFFLPVDKQLHRTLLLLFCVLPGILLAVVDPKILKKPVILCLLLFVLYFSLQDIRGSLPLSSGKLRVLCMQAIMIIFPAIAIASSTPEKKLYRVALRLIVLSATAGAIYSLISFYSANPFPMSRLGIIGRTGGHPVSSGLSCGFAAVLACGLFLQNGSTVKRSNWVELICMTILLTAMFFTHTRTSALAWLAATVFILPGIRNRIRISLALFSAIGVAFVIYFASLHISAASPSKNSIPIPPTARQRGLITTGGAGSTTIIARFDIWKDHFSRMLTARDWVTGRGLGSSCFSEKVSPASAVWYYKHPEKGYQLLPHSGYLWSLYHGGLIGLVILLALLGTAAFTAFRAGPSGYVPMLLLIFTAATMGAETQKLLLGVGGLEYLLLWIPAGLAAGLSGASRAEADSRICTTG